MRSIFTSQTRYKIGISWNDFQRHKANFLNRYYLIKDHNEKFAAGETSYRLDINEHSHFSLEELAQKRLGYIHRREINRPDKADFRALMKIASRTPDSFDWRDNQTGPVVRQVQDQGSCASCWAFAR